MTELMGMRLYKTRSGMLLEQAGRFYRLPTADWDAFINTEKLHDRLVETLATASAIDDGAQRLAEGLTAPIGRQEVWAAGVTYYRSRDARMEEAKGAGAGGFYERVYEAERPELFFKATAARTVGSGEPVAIRADSSWNVPEPELTLFVTSSAAVVGYTVGNDMSSRSIEGENPLYLPQAKIYDGSTSLGPCLYVPESPLSPDTPITLEILRSGETVFEDSTRLRRMKRTPEELVGYLFRACSFEHGCFLMTGTGIVPPDAFTLASGDEIRITIDPIGTLTNRVR